MNLPSQATTHSLRTGSRNRRTTVRYHCAPATPGKVFLQEDQEYQRAWVDNLSQNGVGLILNRVIPIHTVVTLRMLRGDCGEPIDLAAQIMHVEERRDGDVYLGCELLQPLTLEMLDSLLA